MEEKLKTFDKRLHEIEEELSRPEVLSNQNLFRSLNREHSQLAPVVQKYEEFRKLKKELADSRELIKTEKAEEMRDMFKKEIAGLELKMETLVEELLIMLVPKDPN